MMRSYKESSAKVSRDDYVSRLAAKVKRDPINIKLFINHGAIVNVSDSDKSTPLHWVVSSLRRDRLDEYIKAIKILLNKEADINARDKYRRTPLHIATLKGYPEVVKILLNRNADVNARDKNWATPLLTALRCKKYYIAKLLLEYGANVNLSYNNGWTPLHFIVKHKVHSGRQSSSRITEIFQILLDRGADIRAVDTYGYNPLHMAITFNDLESTQILIDTKVNVNAVRCLHCGTPLHCAVRAGNQQIIELLLDRQADIDVVVDEIGAPLHIAVGQNDRAIVHSLLDHGADINLKTRNGSTSLHYAVHSFDTGMVKVLLDRGADVNIVNASGGTPLSYAIEYNFSEDVHTIREIMSHIIRLRVAGSHVSEENLRSLNLYLIDKLRQYEVKCKEELEMLKKMRFGANVSLYHILTTSNFRYLLNKPLMERLESFSHHKFPIYGNLIKNKLKNDKGRLSLSETCKWSLSILIERAEEPILPVLPNEILEKIILHLNYTDFRNLMGSVNRIKKSGK